MNKIVSKEHFSANVVKLEVEAPLIARSRKAGHFVILKVGEKGERIPLTIAGADTTKGTITLVIQAVGGSSKKICELNAGDYITDLVGPLGQATHIEKVGTVVCAGGGVGVAPLLPIVEAFHKAGNRVIVVLAARTKEPVSYTHLDVYKRQALRRNVCCQFRNQDQADAYSDPVVYGIASVSYTHLEVYKRQSLKRKRYIEKGL